MRVVTYAQIAILLASPALADKPAWNLITGDVFKQRLESKEQMLVACRSNLPRRKYHCPHSNSIDPVVAVSLVEQSIKGSPEANDPPPHNSLKSMFAHMPAPIRLSTSPDS